MQTNAIRTIPATAAPALSVRWALVSLSISMLMPSLDTSIANVALPAIADAFAAPFHAVQWIVLAYLIAITILIVGAGRLGDIVGRKRLMLVGIAVFTAASLLSGIAPSLGLVVAARAAQGVGAAMMVAMVMALVGDAVPTARIGSAMGLLGAMSASGTSLGPSIGGFLIAGFGWRTIFLVNVPLGIVSFALAAHALPADRRATRAPSPRFDRALLRDATLRVGLATNMLVSTVMMATLVVGPFYLARGLGLGAVDVGMMMSVGPLVAALSGVIAGRLVDRFGARRLVIVALAGMAAGLAALPPMSSGFAVAGYLGAIVVVTANYALFQTANGTGIMTAIRTDQRGVVSGMLGLTRNLGFILGVSVMGAVFASRGMQVTFVVAAMLIVGALAITMSRDARAKRLRR